MAKQKAQVADWKIKTVDELKKLIEDNRTVLIASIKNLPGSQFQEICKNLRGKAVVKVPKKNLIFRAIDASGGEELKNIKDGIDSSVAILFSNLDSFELAADLLKNKSPAKAKVGQEAPEDINVEAGPTELVPGPAISELGALGIKIQIKDGKIGIKEDKIIVQEGKPISQGAADVMSKLDIKPFSVGFIPLAAFDGQEKKYYSEMKIDPEGTISDLKYAFGKALPFAVEIGYSNSDTIGFLLSKAESHGKALEGLSPQEEPVEKAPETTEEPKEEEKTEEAPAEEEKKEESNDQTPEDKTGGDK
tara:strand:+ start:42 stop:956 length:915 start_codon:yes stop_codon:yes gene_type:complete